MDKEDVIHLNNGILSGIKRNEFESVLVGWMKLEPVRQHEVSKKKKINIAY